MKKTKSLKKIVLKITMSMTVSQNSSSGTYTVNMAHLPDHWPIMLLGQISMYPSLTGKSKELPPTTYPIFYQPKISTPS